MLGHVSQDVIGYAIDVGQVVIGYAVEVVAVGQIVTRYDVSVAFVQVITGYDVAVAVVQVYHRIYCCSCSWAGCHWICC